MLIVRLLVGIALLLLGRRLFWLFVAGVGFIIAATLAPQFLQNQAEWGVILLSLLAGLIGALLAVFLQRFAVGTAGFFAGGYLAVALVGLLGLQLGQAATLVYFIGAIIGAILAAVLFDWALILLSSLLGASLIVQSFELDPTIRLLLFLGALILGLVVQAGMMRVQKPPAKPAPQRPG